MARRGSCRSEKPKVVPYDKKEKHGKETVRRTGKGSQGPEEKQCWIRSEVYMLLYIQWRVNAWFPGRMVSFFMSSS